VIEEKKTYDMEEAKTGNESVGNIPLEKKDESL